MFGQNSSQTEYLSVYTANVLPNNEIFVIKNIFPENTDSIIKFIFLFSISVIQTA